ncbi:MAG TPA: caspase family protein [Thermoanaerobaculia bacterium]|nr:caspase family protein [Thermoanaerobaculia bacterium]
MSTPQNRWALVIGIDQYPLFPPQSQLDGCVRDATEVARVLAERFGFPRRQMTVLLNEQATQEAIQGAMTELAGKVGKGDAVVIHYSGHGSQRPAPAENRDEPDRLEETLVPHDSGRNGHPNRDIPGAQIHTWLREVMEKTPYVTLLLDCCHSGTVTRKVDEEMRAPKVRQVPPDSRRPPASKLPRLRDATGGPASFARYVVLAACRNKESAFEKSVDGGSHGALTFNLLQELSTLAPGACPTYRDVFEPVSLRVQTEFPSQKPQLEGSADRELFGLAELAPAQYVPVRERLGDRIVLAAGATCGLQEGARWTIYPPQAKEGAQPIGRVEIVEVRAVTATARILEETRPEAIGRWARAVEEETSEPARYRPGMKGPEERWSASRRILGLRNDASRLRGKVDFNLARLKDGLWVAVQDGEELVAGEYLSFAVVNHHDQPLHVCVVDFGLTGSVSQIYPVRGASDPLSPGRCIEIGTRPGEEIDLYVPDDLSPEKLAGREEVLKLFATTQEVDLAPLLQPAAGASRGGPRDTRPKAGLGGIPMEDWTTIERRFSLKLSGFGRRGGDVTI